MKVDMNDIPFNFIYQVRNHCSLTNLTEKVNTLFNSNFSLAAIAYDKKKDAKEDIWVWEEHLNGLNYAVALSPAPFGPYFEFKENGITVKPTEKCGLSYCETGIEGTIYKIYNVNPIIASGIRIGRGI